MSINSQTIGRALLTLVLFYLWFLVVIRNENIILLSGVDLIFHEAGHIIFSFLGEFIHILGGTLMQLIVPGSIVIYFVLRKLFFSASVVLFWFGQNLIDISIYMQDAIPQQMPLLGDIHDWAYLFGKFGLLKQSWFIGDSVAFLGVLVVSVSVIAALTTTIMYSFEEKAQD